MLLPLLNGNALTALSSRVLKDFMTVLHLEEELEDEMEEVEEEMKVEEKKVVVQNGKEEEEGVEPQIHGQLPVALAVAPRELGGRKRRVGKPISDRRERRKADLSCGRAPGSGFEETE